MEMFLCLYHLKSTVFKQNVGMLGEFATFKMGRVGWGGLILKPPTVREWASISFNQAKHASSYSFFLIYFTLLDF